jgi:hypothetical protein
MRVVPLAAAICCGFGLAAKAEPASQDASALQAISGAMRYARSPWLHHAILDIGTNPTGWKRQWCARSLNLWLQQSGKKGCGGDAAISCLTAGRKLSEPEIGALAVMAHHVGIVKEVEGSSVTLVSGNNAGKPGARKVGVSKYKRGRIIAYVWPD